MNKERQLEITSIFSKWLIICLIAGVPSFVIAIDTFWKETVDMLAMIFGILTFAGLYTAINLTPWFERLCFRPRFQTAFKCGVGFRVALTICMIICLIFGADLLLWLDIATGLFSTRLVEIFISRDVILAFGAAKILQTYTITLVQGVILSAEIISIIMLAWGCLTAYAKLKQSRIMAG